MTRVIDVLLKQIEANESPAAALQLSQSILNLTNAGVVEDAPNPSSPCACDDELPSSEPVAHSATLRKPKLGDCLELAEKNIDDVQMNRATNIVESELKALQAQRRALEASKLKLAVHEKDFAALLKTDVDKIIEVVDQCHERGTAPSYDDFLGK